MITLQCNSDHSYFGTFPSMRGHLLSYHYSPELSLLPMFNSPCSLMTLLPPLFLTFCPLHILVAPLPHPFLQLFRCANAAILPLNFFFSTMSWWQLDAPATCLVLLRSLWTNHHPQHSHIQGDQKVSGHLMITIQKTKKLIVFEQSPYNL
jgi:hypothetical protein